MIGKRVRPVPDRVHAGDLEGHEGGHLVRLAGHHQSGDQIDVEARELRSAQIDDDGDPERRPALRDPAARAQLEAEEVAEIEGGGGPQGCLGLSETRVPPVQIDVDRLSRGARQPGEERGRALEHPRLGLSDEHAAQEPVIRDLALEVGELRPGPLPDQHAEPVGQRLAQGRRIAVATLGHASRASASSESPSGEPARRSSSSRSATPSPRRQPNRRAWGASEAATTRG